MPYCHSSCRFHSVLNVKENTMSTDFLLERSTGLAGFGGGEGVGKWERVGDCFPSRGSCFQHSRGSKDTAVLPALSLHDWTCRHQLSQSKESPGPAGMQIFGKKRPLFSWAGAWVSPLLLSPMFCLLHPEQRAALAPGNKSRPPG